MRGCVGVYVCMRACVYVGVCMHARVCVCGCVCMHACVCLKDIRILTPRMRRSVVIGTSIKSPYEEAGRISLLQLSTSIYL